MPFYVRLTGDDYKEVESALASRPSLQQPGSVTGQSGFTFTKEDIQGEFDLDVVAGSTTPLDREQTMSILTGLLSELQGMGIRPGGPVVGAIGNIIAENLEMPELQKAIKDEAALNAKSSQEQKESADIKDYMKQIFSCKELFIMNPLN